MCNKYFDVYTMCAHGDSEPLTVRCGLSNLLECKATQTTAHLCLGWCPACAMALTRRTRRPTYLDPASRLTVANYWAFKSAQGWGRPVRTQAVRPCDIKSPVPLPYRRRTGAVLNYEEQALWWALTEGRKKGQGQGRPDVVVLRTRFINVVMAWGPAVVGLIREARHLTLTEWSMSPGKEGLLLAAADHDSKYILVPVILSHQLGYAETQLAASLRAYEYLRSNLNTYKS